MVEFVTQRGVRYHRAHHEMGFGHDLSSTPLPYRAMNEAAVL